MVLRLFCHALWGPGVTADMRAVDVPREEGWPGTYGMEAPMGPLITAEGGLRGCIVDVSMERFEGHG